MAQAPHPDIAAIKQSIELNQVYEVETFVGTNFIKPLKPYSLVIFHSVMMVGNKLVSELNNNGQSYLVINPPPNDILPGIKIITSYNKYNETEAILNKKLFNLQCLWRAEQIDLPYVKICVQIFCSEGLGARRLYLLNPN